MYNATHIKLDVLPFIVIDIYIYIYTRAELGATRFPSGAVTGAIQFAGVLGAGFAGPLGAILIILKHFHSFLRNKILQQGAAGL